MRWGDIKKKAVLLRKKGKTYTEIKKYLKVDLPEATLSYWFKNIRLTSRQAGQIKVRQLEALKKARIKALEIIRKNRVEYLSSIDDKVKHFGLMLKDRDVGKIVLAILYVTEGTHKESGAITFGNSDPLIIRLFLHLLRFCYSIDERKLRCTVQCRADQNIRELEAYWGKITKISDKLFSKAQIDPRTIGKPTKKVDYKGVCRINYFSADLSLELRAIAKTIYMGL